MGLKGGGFRKGASAQTQWKSSATLPRKQQAPYWNTGRKPSFERTAPLLSGLVADARQTSPYF